MSSIIDALKKSDQSRNPEKHSDLGQINFSERPNKSRKGFWLLVITLLVVAFGVFAWQQNWLPDWTHSVSTLFNTDSKQDKPQNPTFQAEKTVNNSVDQQQTKPHKLVPPKQSDIKAQTQQVRKNKAHNNNTTSKQASENQITKPSTSQSKQDSILPVDHSLQPKDSENSASIEKISKKEKADKDINEKTQPQRKQDYLLIHQVDFSIRQNIPAVKISVHIYDPKPENRMVLINGEMYAIGDTIEEVLTIEDILKEGVVMSFENLEFLIPK